jgi:hypothetical protein
MHVVPLGNHNLEEIDIMSTKKKRKKEKKGRPSLLPHGNLGCNSA